MHAVKLECTERMAALAAKLMTVARSFFFFFLLLLVFPVYCWKKVNIHLTDAEDVSLKISQAQLINRFLLGI